MTQHRINQLALVVRALVYAFSALALGGSIALLIHAILRLGGWPWR